MDLKCRSWTGPASTSGSIGNSRKSRFDLVSRIGLSQRIVNCRAPCRGPDRSGASHPRLLPSKHSLVSLITITDGIVTPGPFGIDDDWRYMPRRAPPLFDPTKKLRKGIDLVIMATVWESKQLSFKIVKPGRLSG